MSFQALLKISPASNPPTMPAIWSAVRVSPKGWKVVRPRGSQHGSQPNTAPGTVTPWCSSSPSGLPPALWPRPPFPETSGQQLDRARL